MSLRRLAFVFSPIDKQRRDAIAVSRRLAVGVVGTRESQSAERLSYVSAAAALSENIRTCQVPLDMIRTFDQNLNSLLNCNTPEDFKMMVQRALLNMKHCTSDNPRR